MKRDTMFYLIVRKKKNIFMENPNNNKVLLFFRSSNFFQIKFIKIGGNILFYHNSPANVLNGDKRRFFFYIYMHFLQL